MSPSRYVGELRESGLFWVIAAFVVLITLNLATFMVGTQEVIARLNNSPGGALALPFVFDSWGTVGGLAGVVLLFTPILFGAPVSQRRPLSAFFVVASVAIGVLSAILWDALYDNTGFLGSGSSSIAITSQGILFALAIVGLFRLARQDTRKLGPLSSHWWYSFAIIYLTLILTSLWFIGWLEPIFVPTVLYNWRVHEFGFIFGGAASIAFALARWKGMGLDGVVRIDEMVANFHFDDLCSRFSVRLPKYHLVFRAGPTAKYGELHPESGEIWLNEGLRGKSYATDGPDLEKSTLHAMVHAQMLIEGSPWAHGGAGVKARYDEIAAGVGAPPEQ